MEKNGGNRLNLNIAHKTNIPNEFFLTFSINK